MLLDTTPSEAATVPQAKVMIGIKYDSRVQDKIILQIQVFISG
jgi:hypothetical protein